MFFLIFGAFVASLCTGSWMPILLLGAIGTVAVWGTIVAAGGANALNVRLV